MADNIAVTPGTGKTVATDEVVDGTLGTVQVQFVKIMDGTLDGTSKAAVGANGLSVNVAASVLPTGAATAAKQPALGTAGASSTDVISVQGIASGTALPVSLTSVPSHAVTNAGTFAVQATVAAAATNIAKAEDAASADADVGVPAMAVRKATPANTSGTDGDYEMLQMSAGRLWASTVVEASENVVGKTVGLIVTPSSNFTRPADTTAYAVGDAVSNNTTAASVVALSWTASRIATGNFYVRRAKLKKSTTSVTNASFRLHLYSADPTASTGIVNGDNGVFSTKVGSYVGAIDITVNQAFSDASVGLGAPNVGGEVNVVLASGSTLYGLLEARGAYTPGNAEVFTVDLEIWQN